MKAPRVTLAEIEEEIVCTRYWRSVCGHSLICSIKLANGEEWQGLAPAPSPLLRGADLAAHSNARSAALDAIRGARLKAADALASAPCIARDPTSAELDEIRRAFKEAGPNPRSIQLIPIEKPAAVRVVIATDGAITIDAPYVSMAGSAFIASVAPIPQV